MSRIEQLEKVEEENKKIITEMEVFRMVCAAVFCDYYCLNFINRTTKISLSESRKS